MSSSGDTQSYQKGYEDAMRAAGTPSAPAPAVQTPAEAPPKTAQKVIGETIGILIVFPLMIGLLVGLLASGIGTGSFDRFFVAGAGLALMFGIFIVLIRVGFWVLVRAWPLVLVAVGLYFLLKAVL